MLMLALPLVSIQSLALVLVLSLALALVSSAMPWLARQVHGWPLILVLVVGVTVSLIAAVRAVPLSPWTNLVALVIAWSGGLLLGRSLPARFRPVLLVFLCLSALDVLLAVGGYPQTPHTTAANSSPLTYTNLILMLPWGRVEINLVDLLLVTALAEHWRRRGSGYLLALLPGALGFLLADGVILATGLGQLPAFPFFTAGYVCSEGAYRYLLSRRQRPARPVVSA